MDLTIEIPQDAAVALIRAVQERSIKAQAGEAEYRSWKPDVAEYDSWSIEFAAQTPRSPG
jgi:hypothetical protein